MHIEMDKNSQIKIVGLDLDGTTLMPSGTFSSRVKNAIEEAHKRGVHVIISTGRSFNSLPEELFEIKGAEYVVTSNGASVYSLSNKKIIYRNCISEQSVLDLLKLFREEGTYVEAFIDGCAYIGREEYEKVENGDIKYRDRNYVLQTRRPLDDIYSTMEEAKDRIENISINYPSEELRMIEKKKISSVDDITVTSSFSYNIEIGGKTTSKAEALAHLADILGYGEENIMACGDSMNDLEMIRRAKIGVAVENAIEEVKTEADYITKSNVDDGVAYAIDKFVLSKM